MSAGDRPGAEPSFDSTTIHLRRTYDWSATAPSIAAIEALAHLENIDPTELTTIFETTLHDHVDPEALDTLVRDGKLGSVTVTIDRSQLLFDGNELVVSEVSTPSSE
ncbi:HalOD1 output domain-containing protein [Natronosalvus rutilus]|uniref:Halobacterial output domain-containing protein n=1 Tax=Natronosalvus rutilus TaxID=2953753 RepID=A0A9E7SYE1_9EURY|nr:HalOD1 output domain-containing protein [Natronosalvus rutilus]UTF55946.1 hypothetical protein NGM29_20535 [Natronosalvus rutilus]